MSISAALARGQRQAESLMTLTLTAYSPNGTPTDPDGLEVPAYADEGTTPGKVQAASIQSGDTSTRTITVGGVPRPVIAAGLHIPISAAMPLSGEYGVGWEYVVTAVGANDDPALLGRRFLVVNFPAKSFATARRLDVVEV